MPGALETFKTQIIEPPAMLNLINSSMCCNWMGLPRSSEIKKCVQDAKVYECERKAWEPRQHCSHHLPTLFTPSANTVHTSLPKATEGHLIASPLKHLIITWTHTRRGGRWKSTTQTPSPRFCSDLFLPTSVMGIDSEPTCTAVCVKMFSRQDPCSSTAVMV